MNEHSISEIITKTYLLGKEENFVIVAEIFKNDP